jgi:signal transduction histidine kinase
MNNRHHIVSVQKENQPHNADVSLFLQKLQTQPCSVDSLRLAEKMVPDSVWWIEHFPKEARFVLFDDKDLPWVKQILQSIRSTTFPNPRSLVFCWIGSKLSPDALQMLCEIGVDEVFSPEDPVAMIIPRLVLRQQQAAAALLRESHLKEQAGKEAKTEVTMKQREEFLSVCAHDLRSPLGLIQSSLTMLLNNKTALNDLQVELIGRAKRQAAQAITLVNDLLDVMAFEQGLKPQYHLVRLDAFLSEFYKDYAFQAQQKNIKFHYENPIQEWRVLVDPDRIRQLLQNLFMNALKFTESHKNIYLSVIPFHGRRKADPEYPMVIVSLRDEGKGIPQKEMEKIFDRFTQIKDYSRAEGRGLGLTVAKQISTLHDGNIWVQSVEGEGSTFFVLFPHVISQVAPQGTGPKKKKALVVVRNESERAQYFEILGRWGYEVHFAKDGVEAITTSFYLLPDVVFVTPELKKMDEYEVYQILHKDKVTERIPILCAAPAKVITERDDEFFYDEFVKLPLTRETFQIALDSAQRKFQARNKKKAA